MAPKPSMPQPALNDAAEPDQPWALRIGYALLLFWLIRAWLVPLQQLSEFTEVYRIAPFLIAFAFFLAIDTLRMPGPAAWGIRAAIILAATSVLHSGQWLPGAGWWVSWLHDLSNDAVHAVRGQLAYISPTTRTMLFLTGWAFFIWVLQSFVADRQQLLWFILMTLIYLVALQLIFDTDMSTGLISAAGAGLLLQGWLQAERWTRWRIGTHGVSVHNDGLSSPHPDRSVLWTPIAASCVLTALFMLGAWAGALQHPVQGKPIDWSGPIASWQERLHFLEGKGTDNRPASAARTGYSSDDSRLGYPLTQDDTVVFLATTPKLTYWRGDSKSTYTGKGWYASDSDPVQAGVTSLPKESGGEPSEVKTAALPEESVRPAITQQIVLKQRFTQLFLGGELTRIDSLISQNGDSISPDWVWRDRWSGRYFLPALADPLSSYTVQVVPWNSQGQGQPVEEDAPGAEADAAYLQLPDKLPSRITDLAYSITKDSPTPYAKAQAIEQYLRNHYTYSMEQSRPPGEGQDFVDQFLFEQQMGYCDHFSTAMAVMLRSVGVPARWVKGFSPGQVLSTETNGADGALMYHVEVRNKNAHSWVEVYVPSAGWLPFDPTPGYGGAASADSNARTASAAAASSPDKGSDASLWQQVLGLAPSLTQLMHTGRSLLEALSTLIHDVPELIRHAWLGMQPWLPLSMWITAGCLAALLIRLWMRSKAKASAYPKEGQEAGLSLLSRAARLHGVRAYAVQRASDRLWRKLQRRWGRAEPSQTLREYALTRSYSNDTQREMLLRFIRLQERIRYHAGASSVTRHQLHEAWQNIRKSL
ncbi:transglutaminase domain-containing protein [Paenibacillus sp. 32352]|uniref:transglutaminase family protein n=1 Tax=Paenibacillus sp. 32352 TaxID=1969111 RepID=UPI0009ACC32A|nr:transglutaminase domain-containing protein [Paenibacillus sp. 32352]